MAYLNGKAEAPELDTRFEKVGGGSVWTMVHEIGGNARIGVYGDGLRSFVSVRHRPDDKFVYTLGRTANFIPFPIPKILKALNEEEGNMADPWGGSDIISGSPRVSASRLDPDEVTRLINDVMRKAA